MHHLDRAVNAECLPPQDLQRCQARYADAVFILCDKQASSPHEEDTRNIMTLLAIGQALQQVYGQGIITAKLMQPVRSCWHRLAVSHLCWESTLAATAALFSPGQAASLIPAGKLRLQLAPDMLAWDWCCSLKCG